MCGGEGGSGGVRVGEGTRTLKTSGAAALGSTIGEGDAEGGRKWRERKSSGVLKAPQREASTEGITSAFMVPTVHIGLSLAHKRETQYSIYYTKAECRELASVGILYMYV